MVSKLNDVTYVVAAPGWRGQEVLHVDKLRRLKTSYSCTHGEPVPITRAGPQPTAQEAGIPKHVEPAVKTPAEQPHAPSFPRNATITRLEATHDSAERSPSGELHP